MVDLNNRSRAAWSLWPVPRSLNAPVAFVDDDVNRQRLRANMSLPASVRAQPAAGRIQEGLTAALATRRYLREWGVSDDAARMVDGSALSRWNLASADALVAVLVRGFDESGRTPLMPGLPVAGVDGTLAERMRGTAAAGNVRAKTGAMNGVRSLAG